MGAQRPAPFATAAGALVTALGGVLSWRNWKRTGREWPDTAGGATARARFLADCGVLMSIFFFLVILAEWVPVLLMAPCTRA